MDSLRASGVSLERLGPSATYLKARNEKGVIKVGADPNMVYVEAPGSYQLRKEATNMAGIRRVTRRSKGDYTRFRLSVLVLSEQRKQTICRVKVETRFF